MSVRDVEAMRLAPDLLGGHVGRRAGDLAGPEPLQVLADRQSEVGDVGLALTVDQDVRRLQVAVDQPGPVGVVGGLGDVDHQSRDPRGGKPGGPEHLGQVPTLDVLEDDEGFTLLVAMTPDVVDLHDRRMLQPRGNAGFGLESLDLTGRSEQLRMWDLDRHEPHELVVASEVHVAKSTPAQQLQHRVAAEPFRKRLGGLGPLPIAGSPLAG